MGELWILDELVTQNKPCIILPKFRAIIESGNYNQASLVSLIIEVSGVIKAF